MISSYNGELREQHSFPIAFFIKKDKGEVLTIKKELGFSFISLPDKNVSVRGIFDVCNIKNSQSFYIKNINVSFLSINEIQNIPIIEILFNEKSYLYKTLERDNLDDRLFTLKLKCEEVIYPDAIIDVRFQKMTDSCELFIEFDALTRYKANI